MLTTFSGVAANFAGIPLAFAFVATIGPVGVITAVLNDMGLHLYEGLHFSIFGMTGLTLTYIYFQFPLMILIIAPSLEGLRKEWREAAENLGASPGQYWRHIGFPVLLPALLGAMVLLFGNAFSAYATAVALSGGSINLVAVLIGALVSGNVTASNPQFADATGSRGTPRSSAIRCSGPASFSRRFLRWCMWSWPCRSPTGRWTRVCARSTSRHSRRLRKASAAPGWKTLLFVILPNLRSAMLGASFLTLAIVMGEYTISSLLLFQTFAVYIFYIGNTTAQPAAALAIISLVLTWAAMIGLFLLSGRRARLGGPGGVAAAR